MKNCFRPSLLAFACLIGAPFSVLSAETLLSPAAAAPSPATTPSTGEHPISEKACMLATDRAAALDLEAATAQSQRKEVTETAALYQQAVITWGQAVDQCTGRSQERARRNLADSSKALATLAELRDSGPQCESSHKDATTLNTLAKQAADENRYVDASLLYRKAANMWDLAAERCNGSQQQVALTKHAQSETDAYNTEFCVPVYTRARDQTQRLKSLSAGLSKTERQELSKTAEATWREAASQCKGAAVDIALSNAQALAKERGAPLAVQQASEGGKASSVPGRGVAAASQAIAVGSPAQPNAAAKDIDTTAGDTRFTGRFTLDPEGRTYSGIGRVSWTNGDVYEGALSRGRRVGKGKFTWASGQTYDGEWRDDAPTGRGMMAFVNGNRYEGSLVAGIPNGSGKMMYANGDSYTGDMVDGVPSGNGTFFWKNGNRYSGSWRAGLKEGNGTYTWSNGDRWEGMYRNDQQTDAGKLVRQEALPASAVGTASASAQ